jgi:drug/metabolite transporter (DMT)-like permease
LANSDRAIQEKAAPGRRRLVHQYYDNAYGLLAITMFLWGGNVVASRLAVGEVSPMALVSLRWIIAASLLGVAARRGIGAGLPKLLPHWKKILWMGMFGFTGFNILFYLAAHKTEGINIAIVQGGVPVFVLLANLVFFGIRARPWQIVGLFVTLLGVAAVATHGDLAALRNFNVNTGDLFMVVADMFYAAYTLGLRNRPAVPGLVFFAAVAFAACLTSLPPLALEIWRGEVVWPSATGWLILFYIGIFPSFIAQIFYLRGVDLIGPARAGLFVNLLPVFGALLSVAILREPFGAYHALGLILVVGGIFIAERRWFGQAKSAAPWPP